MKVGQGNAPFVRADGEKERRVAILTYSVDEMKMLPLPVRSREGLLLKCGVWTAAGSTRGINGTSDGLKQPAIVLVLKEFKVQAEVRHGQTHLVHLTGSIGLPLDETVTCGCLVIKSRPQATFDAMIIRGRKDRVQERRAYTTALHCDEFSVGTVSLAHQEAVCPFKSTSPCAVFYSL